MSAAKQAETPGGGGGGLIFARGGDNATDYLGGNFDQKDPARAIHLATSENPGGARGENVHSGVATLSAMSRKNRRAQRAPLPPAAPPPPAPAVPEAPAEPTFREDTVAARLGLPREKIAVLRTAHLAPGEHFGHAGNAVVLTPAGVAALERALEAEALAQRAKVSLVQTETAPTEQSPANAAETALPAAPAPTAAAFALDAEALRPERVRVRVVKTFINRRLILATRERPASDTTQFLVRVRDNQFFHPSLPAFEVIRCGDGSWQYTGRLPRRLGRW